MSHGPLEQAELDALAKVWDGAETVNRIGLVIYQSTQYTQRNSAICVTRETRFGNHGTLSSSLAGSMNYADHGKHILGDEDAAANRIGRELLMQLYNGITAAGLQMDPRINEMLTQISYLDSLTGERKALKSMPFDPQSPDDAYAVQQYRQYYCWMFDLCRSILLGVRRATYKANVQKLKALTAAGHASGFTTTERVPVARAIQKSVKPPSPPELVISEEATSDSIGAVALPAPVRTPVVVKILHRRLRGNQVRSLVFHPLFISFLMYQPKVFWDVLIEGGGPDITSVAEAESPWYEHIFCAYIILLIGRRLGSVTLPIVLSLQNGIVNKSHRDRRL